MLGLTEILHSLELGTGPKQMRKSLYGAYAWPAVATLGLSTSIYSVTRRGLVKEKDEAAEGCSNNQDTSWFKGILLCLFTFPTFFSV